VECELEVGADIVVWAGGDAQVGWVTRRMGILGVWVFGNWGKMGISGARRGVLHDAVAAQGEEITSDVVYSSEIYRCRCGNSKAF